MGNKLTVAEQIAKIPIESIVKMGPGERKDLERYVSTLRRGYTRRVASFARKGLVSHAQISFEGSSPSNSKVQLTRMTRNQLILEFARYAKFFNDITSSEAGIKKVNQEQDSRIFGVDSKGKPKKTMSAQERERFWSLYDEYENQHPIATSRYGSESVQQFLADALFNPNSIDSDNIVDFLNKVEEGLANKALEENMRGVPNVYSGRGPAFQN